MLLHTHVEWKLSYATIPYFSFCYYFFLLRFCGLKGHEMFCEVERSYIEDGFNLYGLRACVSNFSDCLDLILDRIGPDDSDDSHLTQSACTLYGLIHARYIITAHGLDAMYNKVCYSGFVWLVVSSRMFLGQILTLVLLGLSLSCESSLFPRSLSLLLPRAYSTPRRTLVLAHLCNVVDSPSCRLD